MKIAVWFGMLMLLAMSVSAFTIDGNTAYINTSKAYVAAYPHTIVGSAWVTVEVESKLADVNANMVLCFNGEYLKPRAPLQYYNPHNVTTQQQIQNNVTNETETINVTTLVEWSDFNGDYQKFSVNYGGKNTCYGIEGISLSQGVRRKARFLMDVPLISVGKTQEQQYPGYDGKYDIAFYPTSYGKSLTAVQDAIADGKFFLLDPTANMTNELVFWYDFNDVTDSSPNGNNLVLNGDAIINANNSLYMTEGAANYANNDSLTGLTATGDKSFCLRERRRNNDGNGVTAIMNVGDSDGTNDANFFYWLGDAPTWNAGARDYRFEPLVTKNITNNYCFVWFEGNDTLVGYRNGTSIPITAGSQNAANVNIDNARVMFGKWPQSTVYNFHGEIFYAGYWNRALEVDEVLNINNGGGDVNFSDLAAPTASTVNITPDPAYSNDTLTGQYTFSDPDGDSESGTTFRWFVNGGILESATSVTLSPGTFNKTDLVIFEVTPSDGTNFGDPVNSSELNITNFLPVLTVPTYTSKIAETIDLNWTTTVTDNDANDVMNVTAIHYVNGTNVVNESFTNVANGTVIYAILGAGNYSENATVKINFTVTDGTEYGVNVSSQLLIWNPPKINTFNLTPSNVTVSIQSTTITMNCTSVHLFVANATVRISSSSYGPTTFQMSNATPDIWTKSFTPNVVEQHTVEGFCFDSAGNQTTSSTNLTLNVTAAVGGGDGGGGGGGGGGLTIISSTAGVDVLVPASQEINQPFCPVGKTAPDIPFTILNPHDTDTKYTVGITGVVCQSVDPLVVGGKEQASFTLIDCVCPPESGQIFEGFVTITDDRDVGTVFAKVPIRLVGSRIGGDVLKYGLIGFLVLLSAGIGLAVILR